MKKHYLNLCHNRINKLNRRKLKNINPTLVCSNCTGGFIYHWLGLQFRSPFINLYLTDSDFVLALENWEKFINFDIVEDKNNNKTYPIGIGYKNIKIHFMHYSSFENAKSKWIERCKRIDNNNIGFMLTNWGNDTSLLYRFEQLPFKNKVCFTDLPFPELKSCFYIKGFEKHKRKGKNIYITQNIFGKRFIDQFDYISFINNLTKNEKD